MNEHRQWLRENAIGMKYAIAKGGVFLNQWQNTSYSDDKYSEDINNVQIPKKLIVIEYDCEREKALQFIDESRIKLMNDAIQFELYDHKGRSPHLHFWSEQDLNPNEKEFLINKYSIDESVDLNMAQSNRLVACPYAKHWKNGNIKELLEKFDGRNINEEDILAVKNINNNKEFSPLKKRIIQIFEKHKRKFGKDSKVLCPFHDDKNPSMLINNTNVYCFACNKLYSFEEVARFFGEFEDNKKSKEKSIYTSLIINKDGGIFAEQVYNKETDESKFCVYNIINGEIKYEDKLEINGITHLPQEGEEIKKEAIFLPSKAEEYENDEKLDNEIKEFIIKWLDIPQDMLQFALWNIKRSWVYERFHTLNYLRALGDTGMGKTRFLDTLGYLHYKPISTSGATTSAPIFRIIDKWKGTMILDEADFNKSDESQDIIKIINLGYEKGKFIMRCDKEDNSKISFFDPFCPKIIATRNPFQDKATESRCITHIMEGTSRTEILLNINQNFWDELLILRNKLLMWRFKNYLKIDPSDTIKFDLGDLEPRVKQIVTSFVTLFSQDQKQLELFKEFIMRHQEELIEERRNSFAGAVVGAIWDLINNQQIEINAQEIIEQGKLTDLKGNTLKPRGLNSTLRSLGFRKSILKKTDGIVKRCIPLDRKHLTKLFKRYGNDVTIVTIVTDTSERKKELNLNSNLGNDIETIDMQ